MKYSPADAPVALLVRHLDGQVVLVEDDRQLRDALRDALALEGYDVVAAASLSEGRALLAHGARAGDTHAFDVLVLDLGLPDGAAMHLTPDEFKLLAALVRQAGRVITHRELLADVWGPDFTEHTHDLRLYVAQLRAKLEAEPADPRWLLTETGVGYRVAEPEG